MWLGVVMCSCSCSCSCSSLEAESCDLGSHLYRHVSGRQTEDPHLDLIRQTRYENLITFGNRKL